MEKKILGDIDYQADNPENFNNFFDFTVEEIRNRYREFLNLPNEVDEHHEMQEDNQEEYLLDEAQDHETESHEEQQDEPEQAENENIFRDSDYWKVDYEFKVDELLLEYGLD